MRREREIAHQPAVQEGLEARLGAVRGHDRHAQCGVVLGVHERNSSRRPGNEPAHLRLLGIGETNLLESLEEPSDHTDIGRIEYSSVKEVMDWLRACRDGRVRDPSSQQ